MKLRKRQDPQRLVWVVGGSDCSSGAGIQADIKTLSSLNVAAASVISAVTAQNSQGVQAVEKVTDSMFLQQLDALEQECLPVAIKIGLLVDAEQVELLANYLAQAKGRWLKSPLVVLDPVMSASSGGRSLANEPKSALLNLLLPHIDVLIPNIPELARLTESECNSWKQKKEAVLRLKHKGAKAVLVKGGHLVDESNYAIDTFYGEQQYRLGYRKVDAVNSHGTGCTFASAFAGFLAQGYLPRDAMVLSKIYVSNCLISHENTLLPFSSLPHVSELSTKALPIVYSTDLNSAGFSCSYPRVSHEPRQLFLSATKEAFPTFNVAQRELYPVVDSVAWVEKLLKLGIRTIQYREKCLQGDALVTAIKKAVKLGKAFNARVFINDHWQIAIDCHAYGVHLGQEDICTAELPAIRRAGLRLGVSTHGIYELLLALQIKPSYLAIGAIFPTVTKDMTGQIQGLETLAYLTKLVKDIPVVAIGGITSENAESVLDAGADIIAVVTALTRADDVTAEVAKFDRILKS